MHLIQAIKTLKVPILPHLVAIWNSKWVWKGQKSLLRAIVPPDDCVMVLNAFEKKCRSSFSSYETSDSS